MLFFRSIHAVAALAFATLCSAVAIEGRAASSRVGLVVREINLPLTQLFNDYSKYGGEINETYNELEQAIQAANVNNALVYGYVSDYSAELDALNSALESIPGTVTLNDNYFNELAAAIFQIFDDLVNGLQAVPDDINIESLVTDIDNYLLSVLENTVQICTNLEITVMTASWQNILSYMIEIGLTRSADYANNSNFSNLSSDD